MTTALIQPAPQFNFSVVLWDTPQSTEFGDIATSVGSALIDIGSQMLFGAFNEVQGLDSDVEVETYQEGGLNKHPHRFYSKGKYRNLTLKRGCSFNTSMWDWHNQVIAGKQKLRKSGIVILFDRGGPNLVQAGLPFLDRMPVSAWMFDNGLPERITGPQLNAKGNEIAIESMEISHEGLVRLSPSLIPGFADINSALGGLAAAGAAAAVAGVAATSLL
ncbi:phage tail protein [Teredinibacter sp. KSP-S5-2]|uniref:phage tail protein n=1 Tax=Teredinibacter sp. KSP-S5-2 TaxID=3034506 RepID=UPI002934B52C|nr:phage tail protein [Teredinibacter sp. KSP-S5-2]WNO11499.1 phage tail protein [Teredinibacter sp. KSP-S5-2]